MRSRESLLVLDMGGLVLHVLSGLPWSRRIFCRFTSTRFYFHPGRQTRVAPELPMGVCHFFAAVQASTKLITKQASGYVYIAMWSHVVLKVLFDWQILGQRLTFGDMFCMIVVEQVLLFRGFEEAANIAN